MEKVGVIPESVVIEIELKYTIVGIDLKPKSKRDISFILLGKFFFSNTEESF